LDNDAMARNIARTKRVAEQIMRELADIVHEELRDPRVGMITLTGLEMSADHAHAKVFFSRLGDAEDLSGALTALEHACGFLRSQLAHRLSTRSVPELRFVHDSSVERGARLSQLIEQAVGGISNDSK
jgi:ribosome-binding factor A